jgi:chitinase
LRYVLLFIGACVCATAAAGAPRPSLQAPEPHYRIVAYVAGWKPLPVIHPDKLTHINFAFAHIDPQAHVVIESPEAAKTLRGLSALKAQNPNLKIIVSVGGWQAEGFSDAALTDSSRLEFAHSAVQLIREYTLDGIDVDWEYPGQGVAGIKYRPEDKENFTLLLKTLREQLDERYTVTIAGADREYFDHVDMGKAQRYLNWINVMSYDFFNSLTPTTGHHAGLYASAYAAPNDRNTDSAIKQYLATGVPPDKIVVGIAFYGRGFAGVAPLHNGVNQPYERFEGEHNYADLAEQLIGKQGFTRYWDATAQAPYLWNARSRTFISYEDPQSVRAKSLYVLRHHLGGMMFWELSQDRNGELLDVIGHAPHPLSESPHQPHWPPE